MIMTSFLEPHYSQCKVTNYSLDVAYKNLNFIAQCSHTQSVSIMLWKGGEMIVCFLILSCVQDGLDFVCFVCDYESMIGPEIFPVVHGSASFT